MPERGTCTECGGGTYKGRPLCSGCEHPVQNPRSPRPSVQPCAEGEKQCLKCGLVKLAGQFSRDRSKPDGYMNRCKECDKTLACSECGSPINRGRGMLEKPICKPCRRSGKYRNGPTLEDWVCEQCGRVFSRCRWPALPRFCSRECFSGSQRIYDDPREHSRVASRARKLAHRKTFDGVTDKQICERDNWICQIPGDAGCGHGPIDPDLEWPDPLSRSIDHIVPLSVARHMPDFLADAQANKRAAHLACNVRRKNDMHPDDVQAAPVLIPDGLPVRVRGPKGEKQVWLCVDCGSAPARREGASCAGCRAITREARRQQILALREQGMGWSEIAVAVGMSGPGAVYNVAYPPDWGKYQPSKLVRHVRQVSEQLVPKPPALKPPVPKTPKPLESLKASCTMPTRDPAFWWTTVRPGVDKFVM